MNFFITGANRTSISRNQAWWLSIIIGVAIAVLFWTPALVFPHHTPNCTSVAQYLSLGLWMRVVILTPILETVPFLLGSFVRDNRKAWILAYIMIIAVLSFFAHGGNALGLLKGAAFAVLAIQFVVIQDTLGTARAFWGVVVAHATWNLVAGAIWVFLVRSCL